jgi:hypothetical protein
MWGIFRVCWASSFYFCMTRSWYRAIRSPLDLDLEIYTVPTAVGSQYSSRHTPKFSRSGERSIPHAEHSAPERSSHARGYETGPAAGKLVYGTQLYRL